MKQVVQKQKLLKYIQQRPITNEFNSFFASEPLPKRLLFSEINLYILEQLCDKINYQQIFYSGNQESWKLGEYKLFIWVSLYYAFNSGVVIQEMTQKHNDFLRSIFTQRSEQKMRYQLLCIYPSPDYRKKWDQNEIALLKRLIQRQQKDSQRLEWKPISLELFYESNGKYFKTFGQCREMWSNHLNPTLVKEGWKKQQDYLLMTLYKNQNKSWSKIAKKFDGKRTAHMIKNRYYALIKRNKRNCNRLKNQQIEKRLIESLSLRIQKERNSSYFDANPTLNHESQSQVKSQSEEKYFYQDSNIYHEENQIEVQSAEKKDEKIFYQAVEGQSQSERQSKRQFCYYNAAITTLENQEELKVAQKNEKQTNQLQKFELQSLKQSWKVSQLKPSAYLIDSLFDSELLQIPKYLYSEELLQKLGCAHIQQVEQAFQECENWNRWFQF